MDVALPDLDGIGATRELLRQQPDARVLMLSSSCRGPGGGSGRAPAAISSRATRPRR